MTARRDDEFQRIVRASNLEGAKILGDASTGARMSSSTTILRSTALGISGVVDEDHEIKFYQITLTDLSTRTTYIYRFDEDVRVLLEGFFKISPHIGERVEDDEGEVEV